MTHAEEKVAHAVADEKGNSVFMDLIETCHVWWVPSFKGVQRVSSAAYLLISPTTLPTWHLGAQVQV